MGFLPESAGKPVSSLVASGHRKEVPDAYRSHDLAALAAENTLDPAKVPLLRMRSIQSRRAALLRRPLQHVCSPPGSLQVLFPAVLLVFHSSRNMSTERYDSGPTSTDLLEHLVARHARAALNRQGDFQSAEDVVNLEDAPGLTADRCCASGHCRCSAPHP